MPTDQTITNYANELINHYVDRFIAVYGNNPNINRYRVRRGFKDFVTDVGGKKRAVEIIDHYFECPLTPHDISTLLFSYHKFNSELEDLAEDERVRTRLRKETLERKRLVQSRASSNQFSSQE